MEVVSYVNGLSARQFAMEEVQPKAGVAYNSVVETIQRRYAFQNVGLSAEAHQRGLIAPTFERGEFVSHGVAHSIFNLQLSQDGLSVTAHQTEIADDFIEDMLLFCKKEFGYRTETIKKSPLYGSTLVVRLSQEDMRIFSFLERSAKLLQEELASLNKMRSVAPFGIRLLATDEPRPPVSYTLEKRAGVESSDDVYFSQAPLPSLSHEKFLRRLFQEEAKTVIST